MLKLKTVPYKYEFYSLGHLSCKLLASLSAIKLRKDRSREHVYRQPKSITNFLRVDKSIREFYLDVILSECHI